MVRRYVPQKSTARLDKDRRMRRVVELRAEGLSLRQIADRLVISHQTVANDLARWEQLSASVTALPVKSSRQEVPPAGQKLTPGFDASTASVVPIRRSS